ncbi:MAG: AAA family ATPase [Bacteroidales bacterium]|nr:AAA family ATPase [Bacteroidales bacterium]
MLKQSAFLQAVEKTCVLLAHQSRYEFVTPEILLYYGILGLDQFEKTLLQCNMDHDKLSQDLKNFVSQLEVVPENIEYNVEASNNLVKAMQFADGIAENTGMDECDVPHVIIGILNTKECVANDILRENMNKNCSEVEFCAKLLENFGHDITNSNPQDEEISDDLDDFPPIMNDDDEPGYDLETYAKLLNNDIKKQNPLIGREDEMERTLQVLTKKERHNVLYIGEPGVGKTAMIYGLTRIIEEDPDSLPSQIANAEVYQIELTSLLAGSQYRGDFEKRIKNVMETIAAKEHPTIVYIDDINNLVGLGASGDNNNDAAAMMLPYMDKENIRFIGTTNFKDFKHSFEKNKALLRRFQVIEISEPTTEEAIKIVEALKPVYEKYHKVKYRKDTAKYAVEMSVKYISDRHLPEKAIDLMDEAGAYRELHPLLNEEYEPVKTQSIDCKLIAEMLMKVRKIANIPDREDQDETIRLQNLMSNIKNKIFGQDKAVNQVVEAVQMSKAGLLDENKPIASLLFIGQTGVGKTEIAKVLAKELNLELLRFDMSEYTEKHTVAKLIGSPAGYVGYEDGGLLTDAIRKSPNCVLLLDEIEKAHSDIYNILLQVMDYASLTDNKGQKADFKHVILIMTSNVGAQQASQAALGFTGKSTGNAMLEAARKQFKPEFLNRLSGIVVFNDMNESMAKLILDKKLNELRKRLEAKKITIELSQEAETEILKRGFSPKYGAREIDRVLNSMLNPLLMHEILFGKLKKGGHVLVKLENGELKLKKE